MQEEKNQSKSVSAIRNFFDAVGTVILYIVLVAVLMLLIVGVMSSKKSNDGTATIFGMQLRFVQSNSMESYEGTDVSEYDIKSIKVKSCVFIQTIPEDSEKRDEWLSNIEVGDVLTFKYVYVKQETVTHRVVNIEEKPTGGYIITLSGDNKSATGIVGKQVIDTSETNSRNYIVGKVVAQSYILGLIIYALYSPWGIVCFIMIPCLVIIVVEIMRIATVLATMAEEEEAEHNAYMDNLKRRLDELEESNLAYDRTASLSSKYESLSPESKAYYDNIMNYTVAAAGGNRKTTTTRKGSKDGKHSLMRLKIHHGEVICEIGTPDATGASKFIAITDKESLELARKTIARTVTNTELGKSSR